MAGRKCVEAVIVEQASELLSSLSIGRKFCADMEKDQIIDEDEHKKLALRERAEEDWAWAVRQFEKALPEINKQIEIFNLINKIPTMFKKRIHIEKEIVQSEKQVDEEEQQ